MKQRQRRGSEAEQNRTNWEHLLNQAEDTLGEAKSLQREIQGSTDRIEDAWEGTADDVEQIQRKVSQRVDQQIAERQADANFDSGPAAGSPRAVIEPESAHVDPDLPAYTDYDLSDPVTVEEVEQTESDTAEQPAVEPETPVPYTEKEWFKLHSDRFPISESVFQIDSNEQSSETESDRGDRRRQREPSRNNLRDEDNGERTS